MLDVYNRNQHPIASGDEEFSVDVIIMLEEGLLNLGYFHFRDNEWYFHTDTLFDTKEDNFKWIYPPQELINAVKK